MLLEVVTYLSRVRFMAGPPLLILVYVTVVHIVTSVTVVVKGACGSSLRAWKYSRAGHETPAQHSSKFDESVFDSGAHLWFNAKVWKVI
jgi:hypothetical protein